MLLHELNTSPMKTKYVGHHMNNPNIKEYEFTTPNGTEMIAYVVTQHLDSRNRSLEVHFADKNENDPHGNLTGKGNAFFVFSTLAHLMADALNGDPGIVQLIIRGAAEVSSRAKLYRAFANKIPQMFPDFGSPSEEKMNVMGVDAIVLTCTKKYYNTLSLRPDRVNEVKIDNKDGIGQVPMNLNVEYLGIKVLMKPSVFLKLAAPLRSDSGKFVTNHIKNGGAIGAPFLDFTVPQEWEDGDFSELAQISGHEGRNRMKAVLASEGDDPIEVHMFPMGYRGRHITDEWIIHMNQWMYPERSKAMVKGPFFTKIN